jgi:hypothetical protein
MESSMVRQQRQRLHLLHLCAIKLNQLVDLGLLQLRPALRRPLGAKTL